MFIGSRSGKSVFMSDLSLQELSAETYTAVVEFPQSDIDAFVLFDSIAAAEKVAYALRGEWDGSTGVGITDFDSQAFQTAVKLEKAQWCEVGDSELIAKEKCSDDPQMHLPGLPLGFCDTSFIDVRTETNNLLALPDLRGLTFPVSRAEVYWCISDWNGSHHAEDVARGTGFSKNTVQGHLSALEKAGAIRSVGRPKQYTVAEDCSQPYLDQLQSCASLARSMRGTRGG